ncbi:hypothetical protein HY932_01775 [Candidatus Falkowbacteria bacterium]|nr:hypothetical protein [Candidatus Falkowbacteria bacterium]
MEILQNIYKNLRSSLLNIVIYFLLQAILFIALAVLIVIYPFALIIFFSLFLIVLAIISLVIALKVKKYHNGLKKVKELIFGS